MHCDTITKDLYFNKSLYDNDGHMSIKKMLQGDYAMQCFAMFVFLSNEYSPYQKCEEYIQHFKKEMELNKDYISQVYNYDQLVENMANNKMSALLTVEEGATIEGSLDKLQHFYDEGVRMMTLTWNFENEIGYPNDMKQPPFKPVTDKGLKDFGYETVKRMNELGMIVDVSHGSDKLFWDVINTSTKPIVASHSSSRAICDIPRNLTDEMIEKLADKGGITGINYCPDFIGGNTEENQIPMIVEHIKHIVNVGGIDVCGLGSDFDGIDTPVGLSDCSKMNELYIALKEAKFTDEQIEKIFYRNFLRVFKEIC